MVERIYREALRHWMRIALQWEIDMPEIYVFRKTAKERAEAVKEFGPDVLADWFEEETKGVREKLRQEGCDI